MSDIITPEIMQKAANAIREAEKGDLVLDVDIRAAEAALRAALPDIWEAAAREVITLANIRAENWEHTLAASMAPHLRALGESIAHDLRRLAQEAGQ